MPDIRIAATDGSGEFAAYHAAPKTDSRASSPAGAVVVIQEIFGVSQSIRQICDWVADLGFHAVAPDLFWRIEPGVQLTDGSKEEWDKAFALMNAFDQDKGVEDLKATLAAARKLPGSNGHAGTIGFCLGGRLAYMMATRSDSEVNVGYYGVGLDGLLGESGNIKAPLLLHIAELDKFVPPEARDKIVAGLRDKPRVETHVYPGVDHAFARVGGHSWNGRAATIANGRTAEALVAALG